MNSLVQSKNFITREYRFTDSKLYLNVIKQGNNDEIDIKFESIEGDKVSFTNSNLTIRSIGFLCGIIGGVLLIVSIFNQIFSTFMLGAVCLSVGVILYLIYYYSRENIWKLKLINDTYIQVNKEIPSKSEVNEFINELIEARNKYLKENYFMIDENLDYASQLERLIWLKGISAITKHEFEGKYLELKETVKPKQADIGFGHQSEYS